MKYKVFYSGEFLEFDTEVDKPPAIDAQVILQPQEDVGSEILTGKDYYVFRGGRWVGVDIFGLFDFLMTTGLVLFGRTIDAKVYADIVRQAQDDRTGGQLPWERNL